MRKLGILLILISLGINAQETANRFFYELSYKPQKDSAKIEKTITVLDISKDKSIYRDYLAVSQDSILKESVEKMKKSGVFQDFSKIVKMPKFGFKVSKSYPTMEERYTEKILQDHVSYKEIIAFAWKMENERKKIGEYAVQKASTQYGGRQWTAWFSSDIPFQDGPYKFYGLPGLIVQLEDADKNYSWTLQGNKKIENYNEITYAENLGKEFGQKNTDLDVSKEKFTDLYNAYKQDPFASFRGRIPAEMMNNKMPGSEKTIGEMLKEQEKTLKDLLNANNNSIEISPIKEPAKAKSKK